MGGLLFALHANRQWLTDPMLKSQWLEDVGKTKDGALALFNDLKVKPPEPDCSNKRKRKRSTLSEKQLRAWIYDRSIIGGIAAAIGDAIGDAAKLISCAVNVVQNLADSVKADVPDIGEIKDLTDTLAEIAKDLEDENDTKSSSASAMSQSSTTSTSSSSSSSSSSHACVLHRHIAFMRINPSSHSDGCNHRKRNIHKRKL